MMKVYALLLNGPASDNPDTLGQYGPYSSFQEAVEQHTDDNDDVARIVGIYNEDSIEWAEISFITDAETTIPFNIKSEGDKND